MKPIGQQIVDAISYIVLLGPFGDGRRPLWAIVTWWILTFAMLVLVSLYLRGMRWGMLWLAPLPMQWLVLRVSRPANGHECTS